MINRKVSSSALAGALSVILIWATQSFGGISVPAEISSAITTALSFVTGYLVPDAE